VLVLKIEYFVCSFHKKKIEILKICIPGRSHDAAFELFSEGRLASTALKHFAEVGKTDAFDVHRQGFDGVMDTFGADAIMQGEGQAKAKFYMDSNHSLVSSIIQKSYSKNDT
jgi:Spondin_N